MSRKVQINFDDNAIQTIEGLQAATNETMAGVLRDALGFYDWAYQQYKEGRAVGTMRDGLPDTEIILPFAMKDKQS